MGISVWAIGAAALVVFLVIGGIRGALSALAIVVAAVITVFLWNVAVSRGAGNRP